MPRLSRFAFLAAGALPAAALFAMPAAAQDMAAKPAEVRAHVEFLADDMLEGREVGTRGYDMAAHYVATRFRSLGLAPAGDAGGWYQNVTFRNARTSEGASITLSGGETRRRLSADDAFVMPSFTEAARSIEAPLVFVGHGLDEPLLGYDDYEGLDVAGKIVVAMPGLPGGLDPDLRAHLGQMKREAAIANGAAGYIQLSGPRGADRRLAYLASHDQLEWVGPDGRSGAGDIGVELALGRAAQEAIFADARMSYDDIIDAAMESRRVKGFALPARLSIEAESEWTDVVSPTVAAMLEGSDPDLKDEYVVMMGHLDHTGIVENAKEGEDRINNGALDNAAGIATMLEAARLFSAGDAAPRRSILFLALTAEEKGLKGADYFTEYPLVPLDTIVAGVNLDMPVPLYDFTDVVAFGARHNSVAQTVAAAGAEIGISVSQDPMPDQGIFTRSDHYRFVRKGIPAILLFTGYANGGEERWTEFFAKNYHRPGDDLSQPFNWTALARYADLNHRIARRLADDDGVPLWYEGNYFGDRFAPGQARATGAAQ